MLNKYIYINKYLDNRCPQIQELIMQDNYDGKKINK